MSGKTSKTLHCNQFLVGNREIFFDVFDCPVKVKCLLPGKRGRHMICAVFLFQIRDVKGSTIIMRNPFVLF